jgi:prophage regulatory protein
MPAAIDDNFTSRKPILIISPHELPKKKGISFSNPYRHELEKRGEFPKRVKLGARKYGYVDAEIDEWLKKRAALRNATA